MIMTILNPLSIREWAEAAVKMADFYKSLGHDDLAAMGHVAREIDDRFREMHLSIRQYASPEGAIVDTHKIYEQGYEEGREAALAERE